MGRAITHTSKKMVFNALNRDDYPCEPSHSHHIFCFLYKICPKYTSYFMKDRQFHNHTFEWN